MKSNYPLVLLRLYLGVIFSVAVVPKIAAGASYPNQLRGFLENFAMHSAHPFYQHFLSAVVLPNVTLVATLVVVGEACVAVAMLTGIATRLAGLVAMILVTNYMFAKGLWWWYPSSNDGADFMISLALIVGAGGRTFGIDSWLAKRWPAARVW